MGNFKGFNKRAVSTNRTKRRTPRALTELSQGGLEVKEKNLNSHLLPVPQPLL